MRGLLFWARLSIATALLTMALKFGAWQLTGAVSLLSDALESIVNLLAASLAFLMLKLAQQPADAGHRFGHEKAEYFSSGAEGALIMAAGLAIVASAVERWLHPQPLAALDIGLVVALLATLANGTVALLLLRHGRRLHSIALEADGQHLLSDVWTTAGIMAALLVVHFHPQWAWLDPVTALLMALYLFHTGWQLLRRSADGLMDASLPDEELHALRSALDASLRTDWAYADLRTRRAGTRRFIEFKLLLPPQLTVEQAHRICDDLEAVVGQVCAQADVTIHVEPRPVITGG